MKYVLLIYRNEEAGAQKSPEEMSALMAEFAAFSESLVKAGSFQAAERLQPTGTARTVRVRNGKPQVTTGPFAETREQLGGFYLIEAENLDQAIEAAGRVPTAREGSVEVRPIMQRP
jgi:hypothetical protein